jgi:hypothetical protein
MNKYIVKIISPVDSSMKQQLEINANYFTSKGFYYEFQDENGDIIACIPIEMSIILRVKDKP